LRGETQSLTSRGTRRGRFHARASGGPGGARPRWLAPLPPSPSFPSLAPSLSTCGTASSRPSTSPSAEPHTHHTTHASCPHTTPTMTKAASKKSSSSPVKSDDGKTTWPEFRSRRTAELKEEEPNQAGTDRQAQIREEWKTSDENPKVGA
ncbi:hypothetical protein DMC30DRAFT_211022, partial [Rhodotorula diobovata]